MSEREGNDSTGDGTQKKPFKTVLKVTGKHLLFVLGHVSSDSGRVICLVFLNVNFIPVFASLVGSGMSAWSF